MQVVGILNVTPDSFSDGGDFVDPARAVARAAEMVAEGATIIDIGGESTRPGSQRVSAQEELSRVLPVVQAVAQVLPGVAISVDTYKSEVAQQVLDAGATIINSMGGATFDTNLVSVVAQSTCTWVVYHVQGTPQTMQQNPCYVDVVADINTFFAQQVTELKKAGGAKEQLILDPGIGFGKTTLHNIEILKRLNEFSVHGLPVLVGASRKRFLGELMAGVAPEVPVGERLPGSLAAVAAAYYGGAQYVRVHDVLETVQFVRTLEKFRTPTSQK